METQSDTIERLREQIASLEVENEKLYNENKTFLDSRLF